MTSPNPDPRGSELTLLRRYVYALLASVVVVGIRAVLDPLLGEYLPYITLYLGVVFSAWYCGVGPASMTAILSLLAADYFFATPHGLFRALTVQQIAGNGTFLLISAMIIVLGERNRRNLQNLHTTARELEHARNLFRVFMDNSPAVTYLKDEQGRFVFYNARAREKFNLPEAPTGSAVAPSSSTEVAAEFAKNDALVFREQIPRRFNEKSMEVDGEHHWLSFRFPVIDGTGRKLVGSKSFEVTEQRRAENALRQSEERFRAIVETANEGIWLVDRDSKTLYVNRRLMQLMGYSADEMVGRSMLDFCFPEDADRVKERVQANFAGRPEQFDFRLPRRDGSDLFVLVSTSPVRDGSGNIIGALGMLSDITDRERAEEALRQTQERLILAQHAGRIAVWEWNLDTDEVTLFGDIPILASFSGTKEGRVWRHAIHPEDRERVAATLRQAISDGGDYELEYRIVGFSETPAWLAIRGRVIAENGKAVRVLGTATDITESKRTEAALIQSQKLASAGRMAATVAHEINNPLEAVFNLIYLALLDKSLSPETKRTLETADQELQRIAQITKQTLGFYRERSSPAPVDLSELMEQVLRLFARRVEAKNIRIVRDYTTDVTVNGISGELRQVFSNVIANSLEAMSDCDTLHLRISCLTLRGTRQVRVTVADTGVGIDPEYVRIIFEPFFTTKDVGTGLGLWVSDNIVKNHGGFIKVRSKLGKGTVVCVCLPSEASACAQPAAA